MDPILEKAYTACRNGQSCAFATIVTNTIHGTARKAGAKMIVLKNGSTFGTIGGGKYEKAVIRESLKSLRTSKPKLVTFENFGKKGQGICGGKFSVFIEPFAGTKSLIICGGGHIALPLSALGKMLNFKVTVLDSRREFANKKRFSHVDKVFCGNPARHLRNTAKGPQAYIMIVTHAHKIDLACLKAAVGTEAVYIGVISSRTKREKFLKIINPMIRHRPHIARRIQMPAGIDIGSQTPEEIAVSIMAEIIAHYNKDWLHSKKFLTKKGA